MSDFNRRYAQIQAERRQGAEREFEEAGVSRGPLSQDDLDKRNAIRRKWDDWEAERVAEISHA
jgi:hypothetical protein